MYNNYNNPYLQPNFRQYDNNFNQNSINIPQQMQMPLNMPKTGLQGELVENLEIAKNTKVNLDGSTTYLALADGSAIVTKQLQSDGTTKVIIYKPSIEDDVKDIINYATLDDIKEINDNLDEFKDKFKELKTEFKDELKEIRKSIKDR